MQKPIQETEVTNTPTATPARNASVFTTSRNCSTIDISVVPLSVFVILVGKVFFITVVLLGKVRFFVVMATLDVVSKDTSSKVTSTTFEALPLLPCLLLLLPERK